MTAPGIASTPSQTMTISTQYPAQTIQLKSTTLVPSSANTYSTPGIMIAVPDKPGIVKTDLKLENVDLEKAQTISRGTDASTVYQGRKWGIWPRSRAQQYIFCGLSIPLCGLVLGILGAVYYAQNKDAASDDSHGQYLRHLGVIFLSIGWPVFCCCSGAIGVGYSRIE